MTVIGMVLYIARPSAAMISTMNDNQTNVFHEEGFQLVIILNRKMLENANVFLCYLT